VQSTSEIDADDPLLAEIGQARREMREAEQRMRLLVAYAREFVAPQPSSSRTSPPRPACPSPEPARPMTTTRSMTSPAVSAGHPAPRKTRATAPSADAATDDAD
jgi:hypothetical protein